jgi:hypothetical protein
MTATGDAGTTGLLGFTPAPGGCGCGCAGADDCAELSTVVRPRFFCGQLVTDRDLGGITDWAVAHRRLHRLREGWGAVCGLGVRIDPVNRSSVLVEAGHAVSPDGADIVVPAEVGVDLAAACGPAAPCGTPPAEGQPCVLDLSVEYAEVPAEPMLALGRAGCGEAGQCEPSRVRESYQLVPVCVVAGSDPQNEPYRRWAAGYRAAVDVLDLAGLPGQADDGGRRQWLTARLTERPPTRFGFLPGMVAAGEIDDARFARLLAWIALDRAIDYVTGPCPPAGGPRVRLARIWLTRDPAAGGWVVSAVDDTAPRRRLFGPSGWPAPPGQVNLDRVLWQPPDPACLVLSDLGLDVVGRAEWTPSTVAEVRRLLGEPPAAGCTTPVTLRYVTAPPEAFIGGQRVVGFLADASDVDGPAAAPGAGEREEPGQAAPRPATAHKATKATARKATKAAARAASPRATAAVSSSGRVAPAKVDPVKVAPPAARRARSGTATTHATGALPATARTAIKAPRAAPAVRAALAAPRAGAAKTARAKSGAEAGAATVRRRSAR